MTWLLLALPGGTAGAVVALTVLLARHARRMDDLAIRFERLSRRLDAIEKRTRVPSHEEYLSALRAALGHAPRRDRQERAS